MNKNRLTPITFSHRDKNGKQVWQFECECGNKVTLPLSQVKSGNTKSCGCLRREMIIEKNTIHGFSQRRDESKTYMIWKRMKGRCSNKNVKEYKNYGGRGIEVCERWNDFAKFLEDMGERPEGMSIDRIDNNKGYSPDNCQWASRKTQNSNKRNNVLMTSHGITLTAKAWSEKLGISYQTLMSRIRYGWTHERILSEPIRSLQKLKQ